MNEDNIINIRNLYNGENPNFSFVSDIVCNIADDSNYIIQGIPLGFCEEPEEQHFWKKNIVNRYTYLFPYLVLNKWSFMFPSSMGLKTWIDSYLTERIRGKSIGEEVYEQMNDFKKDSTIYEKIPYIMPEIGFIIDSYLWEKHQELPFFIQKKEFQITETIFSQYRDSLLTTVKYCLLNSIKQNRSGFHHQFDKCLKYAFILDSKQYAYGGGRTVFLDILSKLTDNNQSDSLEKILPVYPYYGDDFGLILLNFLKEHKIVYTLSDKTISSYEHKFTYDSWWSEIETRLGEDGKPYNAELCKKTPSHERIIGYLNSRHLIFWNSCHQIILRLVDEIKNTSSTTKQNDLKKKINDRMKILCNEEKLLIVSKITQHFIKNARHEAYNLYINETKDIANLRRKDIPLTEDVLNSIIETLSAIYDDSEIPMFSEKTDVDYLTFASKVSSIWVEHNVFSPDEMNNVDRASENYQSIIKEAFTNCVWQKVCEEIYDWCNRYYNQGVTYSYNYSSCGYYSNWNYNDWSDYDDMRGEIDAHLGGL